MRRRSVFGGLAALAVLGASSGEIVKLPAARTQGPISVEQALKARRSLREFSAAELSLEQLGQLLWAAQGVTGAEGQRTAPSAGALYPLELFAVVGRVAGLEPGVFHYRPQSHGLERVAVGDLREKVAAACAQEWLAQAPAIVVIGAVPSRTAAKYGKRAGRYVAIEVGAAAENLSLQAEALGLGTTIVGAFDDAQLQKALGIGEEPLAVLPVGKR